VEKLRKALEKKAAGSGETKPEKCRPRQGSSAQKNVREV
jgi:hypothetical protein